MTWTETEIELPNKGKIVIAFGVNKYGMKRTLRAIWVDKFHIEDEDNYSGESDWDEHTQASYWPEGWYEFNEHEETHWTIDFPITHWMELPAAPK